MLSSSQDDRIVESAKKKPLNNEFYWRSSFSGKLTLRFTLFQPPFFSSSPLSIRNIADMLAAEGYYTIIPRVLSPCPHGAEGGDGELFDRNTYF
jgi:hypothetical protein